MFYANLVSEDIYIGVSVEKYYCTHGLEYLYWFARIYAWLWVPDWWKSQKTYL